MTEVQDLVVNISQRQMGYMSNKSIDRLSTIPGQLPPRPMANSALSTPTRTPGGSRDRQQFMTPRMSTSPRSRGAIQSPRSMLNRSSSMRTPIRDAQVRGFELTSSPLVRRGSSKDASFRRTREYEQVNSPTYYSWDSSTGEFVEDFEREHEVKENIDSLYLDRCSPSNRFYQCIISAEAARPHTASFEGAHDCTDVQTATQQGPPCVVTR